MTELETSWYVHLVQAHVLFSSQGRHVQLASRTPQEPGLVDKAVHKEFPELVRSKACDCGSLLLHVPLWGALAQGGGDPNSPHNIDQRKRIGHNRAARFFFSRRICFV